VQRHWHDGVDGQSSVRRGTLLPELRQYLAQRIDEHAHRFVLERVDGRPQWCAVWRH